MNNPKQSEVLSIVSLISGIVGFFAFGIILGIVAFVTGLLSLETKLGKVGMIFGILDVVLLLLFW